MKLTPLQKRVLATLLEAPNHQSDADDIARKIGAKPLGVTMALRGLRTKSDGSIFSFMSTWECWAINHTHVERMKSELLNTFVVNVEKGYFEEIRDRVKPYEFRLDNPYWQKRLQDKEFDVLEVRCGYPKNDNKERIVRRKWMGFVKMTITHKHFGKEPVDVFAIRTEGKDVL